MKITKKQLDLLERLAKGDSVKEISYKRGISPQAVNQMIHTIIRNVSNHYKIAIRNNTHLIGVLKDFKIFNEVEMFKHKPLKTNKLRTAGLQSAKSAGFGPVRTEIKNGSRITRNHQGVDLKAENGTNVYAVGEEGEILKVVTVEKGKNGFGWVVCLRLKARVYFDRFGRKKEGAVFAFYAHLSKIGYKKTPDSEWQNLAINQDVKAGEIIGLTGSTGNAHVMTSIPRGSHLHFEIREEPRLGLGLDGRIDPLKFFELD